MRAMLQGLSMPRGYGTCRAASSCGSIRVVHGTLARGVRIGKLYARWGFCAWERDQACAWVMLPVGAMRTLASLTERLSPMKPFALLIDTLGDSLRSFLKGLAEMMGDAHVDNDSNGALMLKRKASFKPSDGLRFWSCMGNAVQAAFQVVDDCS